jgi:hypothetical protein
MLGLFQSLVQSLDLRNLWTPFIDHIITEHLRGPPLAFAAVARVVHLMGAGDLVGLDGLVLEQDLCL